MKFKKTDYNNEVIKTFYIYYYVIKNLTPEQINILLMVNEDEVNYINERNTSKSAEYNWHTKTSFFPIAYKMIAIKSYDMNQLLTIALFVAMM